MQLAQELEFISTDIPHPRYRDTQNHHLKLRAKASTMKQELLYEYHT
jgi:hypothetical protein